MSRSRPNVIWISTEHHRFDTIGALGHPDVRTPNLDRLVESGVAFTHAYSQSPVCVPSRASFLTGRYPAATNVRQNGQDLPTGEVLLPAVMRRQGYDTALFGKMHVCNAFNGSERRVYDGYRMFEWSHAPLWKFGGAYRDWVRNHGGNYDNLYESGHVLNSQVCHDGRFHQTKWCFKRAIEFVEREATHTPFLVSINPFALHDPYQYLPEYLDQYELDSISPPAYREGETATKAPPVQRAQKESGYDRRGYGDTTDRERRAMKAAYFATLEHLDTQLGRMLDALEHAGQRENTLIVLHGDHGDLLGDHGIFGKGAYFYEAAVRVPLILSWPGGLPSGVQSDALVELVDVAPTIYELCGVAPPKGLQGRSLVPVIRGERSEESHRGGVFCQHYDAPPDNSAPRGTMSATMWRDARYKVIVYHGESYVELYDLHDDPYEYTNLAADPAHAELRSRMVQRCLDAAVGTQDPLPERSVEF